MALISLNGFELSHTSGSALQETTNVWSSFERHLYQLNQDFGACVEAGWYSKHRPDMNETPALDSWFGEKNGKLAPFQRNLPEKLAPHQRKC